MSKGESSISLNISSVSSDGGASVRIPNSVETRRNYDRSSSFVDTHNDRGPSFLELLTDTDHLWKRKSNSITNIGHVDSMGRYTSTFDQPPGVNFINVLRAAFTLADPKSAKKTVKSISFFALLGSASVKAACRTLVKLNRGWMDLHIEHLVKDRNPIRMSPAIGLIPLKTKWNNIRLLSSSVAERKPK